ncbi:MAG: hypothetical protein M0014_07995 [Actinomycetota bacterium]|nr:hypothetical protein [Actinomycetota bacterium]
MTGVLFGLPCLSALAELFGTATVWASYRRGARVAFEFRNEVRAEMAELEGLGVRSVLLAGDGHMTPYRVGTLEERFREARTSVADQLEAGWVTTLGLLSYVLGALLGLAAGGLALYH